MRVVCLRKHRQAVGLLQLRGDLDKSLLGLTLIE